MCARSMARYERQVPGWPKEKKKGEKHALTLLGEKKTLTVCIASNGYDPLLLSRQKYIYVL